MEGTKVNPLGYIQPPLNSDILLPHQRVAVIESSVEVNYMKFVRCQSKFELWSDLKSRNLGSAELESFVRKFFSKLGLFSENRNFESIF